jgi:hypothetical protein
MNRTPPVEVRRHLRGEVGFGCPVPDCGNPYLSWHHFDPPWHVKQHHNPAGMIALCEDHHNKADAGAFTKDQLRAFKTDAKSRSDRTEVAGRFDWLRNSLLLVVGGNMWYETYVALAIGNQPIIWLERDTKGYLTLNVKMLSMTDEPRLLLENNDWLLTGSPRDFECPPSGKLIHARYPNDDDLSVEFGELPTVDDALKRFSRFRGGDAVHFPTTFVEITTKVGGTDLALTKTGSTFATQYMSHCFAAGASCAVHYGKNWEQFRQEFRQKQQ